MKKVSTLTGIIIIIVAAVILFGGVFAYQYFFQLPNPNDQPNPNSQIYKNEKYGFQITLPESWKGYSVVEQTWEGHLIDNFEQKYSGPLVIIENPVLKQTKRFQGIPIMVFTPEQWNLVSGPNSVVAVSAAPIGPAKVGENSNYFFATPPRYIGFGDDLDAQQINQVYDIVKTFKAF